MKIGLIPPPFEKGIGNVWKFPMSLYSYGGIVFLFQYLVCLIILGLPMLILELSIGQKESKSAPLGLAPKNRRMAGVGMAAVLSNVIT